MLSLNAFGHDKATSTESKSCTVRLAVYMYLFMDLYEYGRKGKMFPFL